MLTQLTHKITTMTRRRALAATAGLVLGLAASSPFAPAQAADDTIKIGILHSLSGTMAISETTLKDTILFLIDEQNKKAAYSARSSRPSWSTPHRTGRCSPKRPAS